MIYPDYLKKSEPSRKYFGVEISHYVPIRRSEIVDSREYKMNIGDSLYSVSAKLFSSAPNAEKNWPYVAENSRLKRPQDWKPGDILKLPLLIKAPRR